MNASYGFIQYSHRGHLGRLKILVEVGMGFPRSALTRRGATRMDGWWVVWNSRWGVFGGGSGLWLVGRTSPDGEVGPSTFGST